MCDLSGLVDVARHWRSRGERRGMERGQGNPKHFPKTPTKPETPRRKEKKKSTERERDLPIDRSYMFVLFTYNNPSFPFLPPFFFFFFIFNFYLIRTQSILSSFIILHSPIK